MDLVALDFETYPIAQRPDYPPRPVGLAVKWPHRQSEYITDPKEIRKELGCIWHDGPPILCHNSKFDIAVACEGLGMPEPPWHRIHDTMFLAYLFDPHARSLGLKELAADLLAWPAEERDAMGDWVMAHKKQLEHDHPWNGKVTRGKVGKWIFAVPPEIVAPYACGDVDRTAALFEYLYPIIERHGMLPAYDRERQLMPILMRNEREGLRVDVERLEQDIEWGAGDFELAEAWLRRELRASGLNFDADQDVASVLADRGIVTEWSRTRGTKAHPEGQLSMSKEVLLPQHFIGPNGAAIASALGYRNRLKTCLDTFMRPWLAQAQRNKGRITTNWNQVRNPQGGTRTGRPSTDEHNFLNISKSFDGRTDGYIHPAFLEVSPLPLCRKYMLPDEGEVFLHRDFNGQELRVFAEFEQGQLFDAYQQDAATDPHAIVGDELRRLTGLELERGKVKVLNFQAIYGGGAPAAQRKLNCSLAEAKEYKKFHDEALPGRKILSEEILRVIRRGDPIRTWGGRLYFCEPPRVDKDTGRRQTFEYKLINYLVQGSAADLTKQAIIDWDAAHGHSRFLVTVYDEINISAPPEHADKEMALLREMMEAPRLSVPMLSDGKRGPTWGDLTKCP